MVLTKHLEGFFLTMFGKTDTTYYAVRQLLCLFRNLVFLRRGPVVVEVVVGSCVTAAEDTGR